MNSVIRSGESSPAPPRRELVVVIGAGAMAMAIARRLGQRRRLLMVDIDDGRLREQTALLTGEGYEAASFRCDITDRASAGALAAHLAMQRGWSALVHVAGLSPSHGGCEAILSVNLMGAATVAQALLPAAQPGAAAIFIASVAAHTGTASDEILALLDDPLQPDWARLTMEAMGSAASPGLSYQLSKLGLLRLCRREAAAWGGRQVRVVSVSPGLIASPMGAREAKNPARQSLQDSIPMGREGSMLEIADAVEFLTSERAAFITGTDLLIDGGMMAARDAAIAP